jgi:hypothetical protein
MIPALALLLALAVPAQGPASPAPGSVVFQPAGYCLPAPAFVMDRTAAERVSACTRGLAQCRLELSRCPVVVPPARAAKSPWWAPWALGVGAVGVGFGVGVWVGGR